MSPVRSLLGPSRWERMGARTSGWAWRWNKSSSRALPAPVEPGPEAEQEVSPW